MSHSWAAFIGWASKPVCVHPNDPIVHLVCFVKWQHIVLREWAWTNLSAAMMLGFASEEL
jgi:hypothetical protein